MQGRASERSAPGNPAPSGRDGHSDEIDHSANPRSRASNPTRLRIGTSQLKRPLPDGTTHLLFTGLELLRRVASLVPPPRTNLTRFHGVFAPGAQLRPFLVPHSGSLLPRHAC
ncbi:transposase [Cystobacter ferrugineus]|uniref:transposase n=1 Tax=Cystobacter ferrugineus TaxID=83449 RepID=UPI000903B778